MKKMVIDSRGQALMQVLIAIPIVAIISLVIATMLSNMSREIRVVQQKMEIMQFENYMTQVFSDDARCGQIVDGTHIITAGATTTTQSTQATSVNQLKQGTTGITYVTKGQPLTPSSQVKVSNIQVGFAKKETTGGSNYQVTIEVDWDTTNMPMSLKPLQMLRVVTLDASDNISSCNGSTSGSGTCSMVHFTSGCAVANDGAMCGSGKPEQQVTCNCPSGAHPTFCSGSTAGYAAGTTCKSGTCTTTYICKNSGFGTLTSTGCTIKGYGAYSMDISCCQ